MARLRMYSLRVNLLACSQVGDNKSHAWRRSDWSSVLLTIIIGKRYIIYESDDEHGLLTLSPKPHIRARMGCCATSRLDRFDKRLVF